MKRLIGLDVLRGIGILCMVFLHSATFHYQAITEVDFDNPPWVITLIGFLLMWAGLFAILSGAAYAYSSAMRLEKRQTTPAQIALNYIKAGLFMLVLHYVYFILLAPKLLDVEHGRHQYALLPGLIAHGRIPTLSVDRVFYSTALSMVAWNLMLIGPLVGWLLKKGSHPRQTGIVLGGSGTLVILLSLVRLPMYPITERAIQEGNWIAALALGFLFNKNNPILPFLGFGLFGAWLGLSLARAEKVLPAENPGRVLGRFAWLGAAWLIAGIAGLILLPDTMLEREIDLFWYFIVLFQLGLFLLLTVLALALLDMAPTRVRGAAERRNRVWPVLADSWLKPVRRVGTVSLSIFMLETVISQILVKVADRLLPGWSLSITLCLAFGAVNVLLWVGWVWAWAGLGFRYGMEWWSVRAYALLGRSSDKMRIVD